MLFEKRNIQYFISSAKHLSFSKAADENYTSQPTVSRQIGQIEAELGVNLFIRKTRALELTPAGEQLLSYCTEILDMMEAAEDKMLSFSLGASAPRLSIGLQPDAAAELNLAIGDAIKKLRTRYPELAMSVKTIRMSALSPESLPDAFILSLNCDDKRNPAWHYEPLFTEDLYLFWGGTVPCEAGEDPVCAVLRNRKIILFRDTDRTEHICRLLDSYGISYSCEFQSFNPNIMAKIGQEFEYAIVYALPALEDYIDIIATSGLSYASFRCEQAHFTNLYVYSSKSTNPYVRKFLQTLKGPGEIVK